MIYRTSDRLAPTSPVSTSTALRRTEAGLSRAYGLSPLRRWYFRAATPAETSPDFSASWTEVDGALRRYLSPAALADDTIADGPSLPATAGNLQIDRQYITPPLRGGVLLSTFSGVIACLESNVDDNAAGRIGIRVVTEDGSTVQATLLAVAAFTGSAEYSASARGTRRLGATRALTSYTTAPGDRIVVEIGFTDASGTTPQARHVYGSSAGSDYALTDGLTTVLNPWIEFA